jgi:hypothetical protein
VGASSLFCLRTKASPVFEKKRFHRISGDEQTQEVSTSDFSTSLSEHFRIYLKSSQSKSYITTDGQSANLSWCQAPIWNPQPNFFLFLIIIRQLWVFWCRVPSVTRGRDCSLQSLLGLASTLFLWSHDHIILYEF